MCEGHICENVILPLIGASLSEPHTSVTALRKCVFVRGRGGMPPRLIFWGGNCPHCPPPGSAAYALGQFAI